MTSTTKTNSRKPEGPPVTFERYGKAYVGHAIALTTDTGAEIIVLAPTLEEAVTAAKSIGIKKIDRKEIRRAAVIGEMALRKLEEK